MSNRSIQKEDIKHLYIHITEISKTVKLIVSNKKTILFLKNDIVSKLTELGFNSTNLTEKNINIKYSGRTLNNNKYKSLHIGRFTNTPSLEVFSSYPTNAPQSVDFECSQNPC